MINFYAASTQHLIWKNCRSLVKPFLFLMLVLGCQQAFAQTNIQVTGLSVNDNTPSEGQTITFTVTIRNNGPQATTALKFLDQLPAGLTFVSSTPQQGTYTPGTGIWDVGALNSGQNRTLSIVATVNTGTSGTIITNIASYSSSTPADNNAADNSLSVAVTVNKPDILVTKTVNDALPNEGQNITYTVTARNLGSADAIATGVVVTDLLPAGLTFVSAVPSQGAYNSGTGAWTIGTMIDNAAAVTLAITATVNAGQSGLTKTNTASVTAIDQPEENGQASTAFVNITVNQPDIEVTKSVNDATPDVGQNITYTITAKNIGVQDAPATGLVITDLLPAGLSFVSAVPSVGSYNSVTGAWTIGTLADNVTVTLTITATVNAGQTGATITNTGAVSAINQTEPNTANNSASIPAIVNSPDILVTKTVSNPPYNENTNLTYTITVRNQGTANATNVVVQDQLASLLTFVSATPSQGSYSSGTGLWTIGSIATGTTKTLTITVFPKTGSSGLAINNTASLNSMTENDPATANNTASVEIEIAKVDLLLEKSVNDASPDVGQTITYTLKITNSGPGIATNIVIKDIVPAGLTWIANGVPGIGTATHVGDTVIWTIPTLTISNRSLTFTATVNAGYGAKTITNTAAVTSFQQVDPNLSNNTASIPVIVNGADLALTKVVSNAAPSTGSNISYTITVTNNGPVAGNDVQITDLLPAGVAFVSASADESSYNPGTGVWGGANLDLAIGETRTLTINATVTALNGTLVNNTASISTQTAQDGITSNNSASAFFVVGNADVSLTKLVIGSVFSPGNTVTYTLTLTNNGPFQAAGFAVSDTLPAGVTYVSSSATLGSYNNATGLWTFGTSTLANGLSATLTIDATVNAGTAGFTITNNAKAISVQGGNNTANDNAAATFKVTGADIAVTKTASASTPTQGDPLTYTITVTNNGPDGTTGLIIKDLLPTNLGFVSSTASTGSYDNITGEWNIGTLANAAVATLTINTTITKGGGITNTASVLSSTGADNNTANNSASVFTSALKTFAAGACIIDMGVIPQTANSGLRPYGLVYELVNSLKIPVNWAINPGKTFVSPALKTDQPDFTVAGKSYYGGAFIIPAEYVSIAQSTINSWVSLYPGLTVDCGRPAFTAPIHEVVTSFPKAVLDAANGSKLIDAFYAPAGIPTSSYRANGTPSNLTTCDDSYGMPHADPQDWTLQEKTTLDNYVKNGGWLFLSCHAVSALESLVDLNGDGIGDLNYLSNAGLVPWGSHSDGTLPPPYYYATGPGQYAASVAADPFMQFLGRFDGALQNGSEQINIPRSAGWRPSTTVAVWDHDHPQVLNGTYPPGPAAALAYGRAFGNPAYGMIMEFTSHTFQGGSVAENTAAGRTYGNFILQAGIEFKPKITVLAKPDSLKVGVNGSFSVNVSAKSPPISYLWSSSCGGTFSDPTSPSTGYTPPVVDDLTSCIVRVTVTDACGRTNFESFVVIVVPQTDVSITKVGSPDPVFAGNNITYTITATNNGPSLAKAIAVNDVLPAGLSLVSATPGAGTWTAPNWSVGDLASGASAILTIVATVDANVPTGTIISNTATISTTTFESNIANNTATATTTVNTSADLSITKTDSPDPVIAGNNLTYTIVVTNNGPSNALAVSVNDVLPAGLAFVSATPSVGSWSAPTWTIGTLAAGDNATLTILATVSSSLAQGSVLTNTATVSSTTADPNSANNSATSTTNVNTSANLAIQKAFIKVSPGGVGVNPLLEYSIAITNNGPSDATGVVFSDSPTFANPDGFQTGGLFQWSLDGISWTTFTAGPPFVYPVTLPSTITLAPGATSTIYFRGEVSNPAKSAQRNYTNTATASSDVSDPVSADNTVTITVEPGLLADLSITKTDSPDPVIAGDILTYTLVVSNAGPELAPNVIVTDALSATYFNTATATYTLNAVPQGSWTGSRNVGNLISGASATIVISVQVRADLAAGTNNISNTASVVSEANDPDLANNSATATTSSSVSADLSISKVGVPDPVVAGELITYTLIINNLGPSDAPSVQVADAVPVTLLDPEYSIDNGATWDPWTGVYNYGALAAGTSFNFLLRATVSPSVANGATLTNTASVSSTVPDPSTANNSASDDATVNAVVDLTITKTDNSTTYTPGVNTTYTIIVTNSGPSNAAGATVADAMPAGTTGTWTAIFAGGATGTANGSGDINQSVDIPVGGSVTYTVIVTVPSGFTGNLVNTATATAAAGVTDNNTANNTATDTDTQNSAADLGITKQVNDATPLVGSTVIFTMVVTNYGPSASTGFTVTDVLPAGYDYVSSSATLGSYNNVTHLWTYAGPLSVGGTATLTITATVLPGKTAIEYNNIAAVSGTENDNNAINDEASDATTPVYVASVSSETEAEGDALVHTVTMSGAADAPKTYPFAIIDVTATGGVDYSTAYVFSDGVINNGDGTITVPAGVTSFTVTVQSTEDSNEESDETYTISIGGQSGTGTITNDDTVTVTSVSSESEAEGDALVHTVILSGSSNTAETFPFSVTDVTTTAGTDYSTTYVFSDGVIDNGDGTITVPPGVTSFTVTVQSTEDPNVEPDESYTISIGGEGGTGTILDDDSPDLTPTISASSNVMHGVQTYNTIIRVTELLNVATSGTIQVVVPKNSRVTFTFNPNAGIPGVSADQNSIWTYSSTAFYHIFTTSAVIPAGGQARIGFVATFNPNNSQGRYTLTAQIIAGSGGEIKISNNSDAEQIDYFPN